MSKRIEENKKHDFRDLNEDVDEFADVIDEVLNNIENESYHRRNKSRRRS